MGSGWIPNVKIELQNCYNRMCAQGSVHFRSHRRSDGDSRHGAGAAAGVLDGHDVHRVAQSANGAECERAGALLPDARFDAYRTRTGPLVEHRLRDGLSFWGGAYFQHVQAGVDPAQSFDNLGRFFGGLTYRAYRKGKLQVDGRTVAERFVGVRVGDSSRFRQRVLVNFDKRVAPYVSNEIFWNATGVLSNRVAAGVRTRFHPEWALMTGFLWETRSFAQQPSRGALRDLPAARSW